MRYTGSMRISWLEPQVVSAARAALQQHRAVWAEHFRPVFAPPPAPAEIEAHEWPRIAEHVARAERVGEVIREGGLIAGQAQFGNSVHAIELATLAAAAVQNESLTLDFVVAVLRAEVDDLLVYGEFLRLLETLGRDDRELVKAVYTDFCHAFCAAPSQLPMWRDRVDAVRDGLAGFLVRNGDYDEAEEIFLRRHEEETGSLVVALTAGRAYLSAGAVGRSMKWLERGAERASVLGRPEVQARLEAKREALRARQS